MQCFQMINGKWAVGVKIETSGGKFGGCIKYPSIDIDTAA